MSDLIDLLETEHFQLGLQLGLFALAVGYVLVFVSRRRKLPLPVVGVLIAGATMWALSLAAEQVSTELGALGLILAGGLIARVFKASDRAMALLVLPGALWLAVSTDVTELFWVRAAMAMLIPIGGYLINDFEKRHAGMGLGVIFYTLATLGVFASVPETEWVLALMAVAVIASLLAWPRVNASLGREGAYVAIAVFIILTAQGGGPRPASIVGGLACLGLLLIEPLTMALNPGVVRLTSWPKRDWAGALVAALPQFAVVVLCSRVAARFTNEVPALVTVVLVYVGTMALAISAASSSSVGVERSERSVS